MHKSHHPDDERLPALADAVVIINTASDVVDDHRGVRRALGDAFVDSLVEWLRDEADAAAEHVDPAAEFAALSSTTLCGGELHALALARAILREVELGGGAWKKEERREDEVVNGE